MGYSVEDPSSEILPHHSERTLRSIRRISRITTPKCLVLLEISYSREAKQQEEGGRTNRRGTLSDLLNVEKKLASSEARQKRLREETESTVSGAEPEGGASPIRASKSKKKKKNRGRNALSRGAAVIKENPKMIKENPQKMPQMYSLTKYGNTLRSFTDD